MATILPWRIPLTEEPGGQQSMGSHTVRRGFATTLLLLEESKCGVSLLYRNCPDSLQSIKYGGLFIFREVCETI